MKDHKYETIELDQQGRVQIYDDEILDTIKGGMAVMDEFGDQFSNGACVNASCS